MTVHDRELLRQLLFLIAGNRNPICEILSNKGRFKIGNLIFDRVNYRVRVKDHVFHTYEDIVIPPRYFEDPKYTLLARIAIIQERRILVFRDWHFHLILICLFVLISCRIYVWCSHRWDIDRRARTVIPQGARRIRYQVADKSVIVERDDGWLLTNLRMTVENPRDQNTVTFVSEEWLVDPDSNARTIDCCVVKTADTVDYYTSSNCPGFERWEAIYEDLIIQLSNCQQTRVEGFQNKLSSH